MDELSQKNKKKKNEERYNFEIKLLKAVKERNLQMVKIIMKASDIYTLKIIAKSLIKAVDKKYYEIADVLLSIDDSRKKQLDTYLYNKGHMLAYNYMIKLREKKILLFCLIVLKKNLDDKEFGKYLPTECVRYIYNFL
jgi:hypothetical protein